MSSSSFIMNYDVEKTSSISSSSIVSEIDISNIQYMNLIQKDIGEFNKQNRQKRDEFIKQKGSKSYYKKSEEPEPTRDEMFQHRATSYQLNQEQLNKLIENKVLIVPIAQDENTAKTFGEAYSNIYSDNLPVFISSDCMLYALHRLYSDYLEYAENTIYIDLLFEICQQAVKLIQQFKVSKEHECILGDLEHFFMVPLVLLSLKTEMRSDMKIVTKDSLNLLPIEEVKNERERIRQLRRDENRRKRENKQENKTQDPIIDNSKVSNLKLFSMEEFLKENKHESKLIAFAKYYYDDNYPYLRDIAKQISQSEILSDAFRAFEIIDLDCSIPCVYTNIERVYESIRNISLQKNIQINLGKLKLDLDGTRTKPRAHYCKSYKSSNYFRAFLWISLLKFSLFPPNFDYNKDFIVKNLEETISIVSYFTIILKQLEKPINQFTTFIRNIVGRPDAFTFDNVYPFIKQHFLSMSIQIDSTVIKDSEILNSQINYLLNNTELITRNFYKHICNSNVKYESFLVIGSGNTTDNAVINSVTEYEFSQHSGAMVMRKFPSILDIIYILLKNESVFPSMQSNMKSNVNNNSNFVAFRDGWEYSEYAKRLFSSIDIPNAESEDDSLYNQQLRLIATLANPKSHELMQSNPLTKQTFGSKAWGLKQANTQIGHYTELRHDNVLYIKEFTGCCLQCYHPDLMVEPNPIFWQEYLNTLKKMRSLIPSLSSYSSSCISSSSSASIKNQRYYNFESRLELFEKTAERLLAFSNSIIKGEQPDSALVDELKTISSSYISGSSATYEYTGWYPSLFKEKRDSFKFTPECSTLFTAGQDIRGKGGIVHLGCGPVQNLYVIYNNKVFLGACYSTYEFITEEKERLNDDDWSVKYKDYIPLQF